MTYADPHSARENSVSVSTVIRGVLQKKRAIGWQQRFFVLTPNTLSYFNTPTDSFPAGFISVSEILEVSAAHNVLSDDLDDVCHAAS